MIAQKFGQVLAVLFHIGLQQIVLTRDDAVFLKQPKSEPYFVSEGQEGPLIECSFAPEYRNRTRYEPSWTVVAADLPRHLTRNGLSFAKQHYQLVQTNGGYGLRIANVNFHRDNGKFFCTLLDKESGAQYTAQATIIVVLEPQKPVITRQPFGAIQENELVTIECQATGGNPTPSFTWVFNNRTDVPSDWYQVKASASPDRPSVSILQWHVNARDNDAYLSCRIWNEALAKGEYKDASTTRLNVLFAPRVRAGPVSEYSVEVGEHVELVCTADGNPAPTQYEWYHVPTGERFSGANWHFIAEKKHSGEFRCTATNSIDSGADKLRISILFGPLIKVEEWLNPAEGDTVVLDCLVQSNPAPSSIVWTTPNGVAHKGPKLRIDSITRSSSGNYTCTAINTLTVYSAKSGSVTRTGQAVTVIDVLRRPGQGLISASEPVVPIGGQAILTCTTNDYGSPEAEFRWLSTNGRIHSGAILAIDHASLADNGDYRCVPHNRIGDGSPGVFTLQVIEPAVITGSLPEHQIYHSGEAGVSLFCESSGFPAPTIDWYKDGQLINEQNKHWTIESKRMHQKSSCKSETFCAISVVSAINFMNPLTWTDKGNYTCSAENGLKLRATSSALISVMHAPVTLNQLYPVDALAASDIESTASIVCRVSARPMPKFVWFWNASELRDGAGRYSIRTSSVADRLDEFESMLQIAETTGADHGPYLCRATNMDGEKAELIIKLQSKSKPQAPSNIQVISSTSSSILAGWRSGFDGGEAQTFHLEYRRVNPVKGIPDAVEPITVFLDEKNSTLMTIYEIDDDDHRGDRSRQIPVVYFVQNITGLSPLSTYWFRMRAQNFLGTSDWTPVTTATTGDVHETGTIPRPLALFYNVAQNKIDFESAQLRDDLCLLLMVANDAESQAVSNGGAAEVWHTVDCYDQTPIYDVQNADFLRARLCQKRNPASCSVASEVIVSSTLLTSGWRYLLPVIVLGIFLVLFLCLLLICAQMRRNFKTKHKKIEKVYIADGRKPEVIPSLTHSEMKNAVVHCSQNDSGVFTLGSTPGTTNQCNGQVIQQQVMQQQSLNPDCAPFSEHWCTTEEQPFSYMNGNRPQYTSSPVLHKTQQYNILLDRFSDGHQQSYIERIDRCDSEVPMAIHEDDQSDRTSCTTSGGRRVMREIIV